MNASDITLGIGMLCVGIFIVILQIRRFRNGLKDEWGYESGLLISGFGAIVGGVIIIVKSF